MPRTGMIPGKTHKKQTGTACSLWNTSVVYGQLPLLLVATCVSILPDVAQV